MTGNEPTRRLRVGLAVGVVAAAVAAMWYASRPAPGDGNAPVPPPAVGRPVDPSPNGFDQFAARREAARRESREAFAAARRTGQPADPPAGPFALHGLWVTDDGSGPQFLFEFDGPAVLYRYEAANASGVFRKTAYRVSEVEGVRRLELTLQGVSDALVPSRFTYRRDGRLLRLTVPEGPAAGEYTLRHLRMPIPPPPAQVVLTGREKMRVTMSSAQYVRENGRASTDTTGGAEFGTLKLGDALVLAVAYPSAAGDRPKPDTLVAVRGRVTATEDRMVLLLTRDKEAKRAPLLEADAVTLVTDQNRAAFPAENTVWVEGVVVVEGAGWGIRNGDGRIPIEPAEGVTPPAAGTRVRVTGGVRVEAGELRVTGGRFEPRTD